MISADSFGTEKPKECFARRLLPVEVELILEIEHATNYPKGFDMEKTVVKEMAVKHAMNLRSFLELGIGPMPDIFQYGKILEFVFINAYWMKYPKHWKCSLLMRTLKMQSDRYMIKHSTPL